jgi:tRNA G26 N,N-dimethylase Trm1
MVEVFKTNVQNQSDAEQLASELSKKMGTITVHFDLNDCDKVLRIESKSINPLEIIELMNSNGFQCEVIL